jgi:hypothetical protein
LRLRGRSCRSHRGIAEEIEVAGQRRAFRGRLLAVGFIVYLQPDALEQLLDRQVLLMRQPQEGAA